MTENPRWLNDTEEHSWRAYIEGTLSFLEKLDRELRAEHGISNNEYEVLVRLSEAPERTLRMAELAASTSQSRSRLSHTISRMEKNGIVIRKSCGEDGRGVFATLTEAGWALIVRASKTHLRGVRQYFVDVIQPEDLKTIGEAFSKIRQGLGGDAHSFNRCPATIPGREEN
ncbi:MAG: winged helix-turn-helix transcriptional regulator [Corynebacteriales bacterium]|nr:winged helix-turn-helix transcriptional regulator [Mycobacteriales bacterium]